MNFIWNLISLELFLWYESQRLKQSVFTGDQSEITNYGRMGLCCIQYFFLCINFWHFILWQENLQAALILQQSCIHDEILSNHIYANLTTFTSRGGGRRGLPVNHSLMNMLTSVTYGYQREPYFIAHNIAFVNRC